jgi:hypothetical protein
MAAGGVSGAGGSSGASGSRGTSGSSASGKTGGSTATGKTATSTATGKTATSTATGKTTATKAAAAAPKAAVAGKPNPKLAAAVDAINIQQYHKRGTTTFCSAALNAYAKQLGYNGFANKVANEQIKTMQSEPGWHKTDAAGAIAAAAKGQLAVAGYYNNTPQAGRPDGRKPGHVAAVIGEFSPGVPGIAQAGTTTFAWGAVTQSARFRDESKFSYYVHD